MRSLAPGHRPAWNRPACAVSSRPEARDLIAYPRLIERRTAKILTPTAERLKDAKTKHQERLKRLRAEERQRRERGKEQRAARAAEKRGTRAKAPPPKG